MKFIIKSLLFVNLLLQMTNSLKSCFDHDQNIMITIILLAFSVIGLIGLVIGNRFILIIFSASMTLILIASITIYAIGSTEEDSMKPKVPHYTNLVPDQDAYERALSKSPTRLGDTDNKLRSLVDKWFRKNNTSDQVRTHKGSRNDRTRLGVKQNSSRLKTASKKVLHPSIPSTVLAPALLDELSDEPTGAVQDITQEASVLANVMSALPIDGRTAIGQSDKPNAIGVRLPSARDELGKKLSPDSIKRTPPNERQSKMEPDEMDSESMVGERVESEQWVAYERYLYEKYMNIISQSIDLVMHTILASWMALLLDDDSDQCFGPKTSASRKGEPKGSSGRTSRAVDPPVYNYNGVRYSIRPDLDESQAHIVAH